jgi:iron(III) transport system ATP-binding protein
MSDLVAVMEDGLIAQTAPPIEIYQRPGNRFVAEFIGHSNFLGGTVRTPRQLDGLGIVDTAAGALSCVLPDGAAAGHDVTVVIRPEDVHFADTADGLENVFQGEVTAVVYMGEMLECQVALGNTRMRLRLHPSATVEAGQSVSLAIAGRDCRALAG